MHTHPYSQLGSHFFLISFYIVRGYLNSLNLISGAYDRTVKCWDVNTGQRILSSFACVFSMMVNLLLKNLRSGKAIFTCDTGGFVQAVMLEPEDNNIFFVGNLYVSVIY